VNRDAICLAAAQADEVARRVIDRVAEHIADAAVIIANALDIELLVLAGKGVTLVADIYREKVTEALRTLPLARKTHTLRVAISEMSSDGAALGAATLVLHANYAPNTAHLVSA